MVLKKHETTTKMKTIWAESPAWFSFQSCLILSLGNCEINLGFRRNLSIESYFLLNATIHVLAMNESSHFMCSLNEGEKRVYFFLIIISMHTEITSQIWKGSKSPPSISAFTLFLSSSYSCLYTFYPPFLNIYKYPFLKIFCLSILPFLNVKWNMCVHGVYSCVARSWL